MTNVITPPPTSRDFHLIVIISKRRGESGFAMGLIREAEIDKDNGISDGQSKIKGSGCATVYRAGWLETNLIHCTLICYNLPLPLGIH